MAFHVYHNPRNVTLDATPIRGVQSVAWSTEYTPLTAAGDDDAHVSVARYTTARTYGSVRFLDPNDAVAAAGLSGTLSFEIADVQGGTNKTVTVANCSLGGYDATVARDQASGCVIPFLAETAPNLADAGS